MKPDPSNRAGNFVLDITSLIAKNMSNISETIMFSRLATQSLSTKFVGGMFGYLSAVNLLWKPVFLNTLLSPVSSDLYKLQNELFIADCEQISSNRDPNLLNNSPILPTKTEGNCDCNDNVSFSNFSKYMYLWGDNSNWNKNFSYLLSKLNLELSHGFSLKKIDSKSFLKIETLDFLTKSSDLFFTKIVPIVASYFSLLSDVQPGLKMQPGQLNLQTLSMFFYTCLFSESFSRILKDFAEIIVLNYTKKS
ncbi:hypothetical protein BB558_007572 [Smittium angustum]|nr:hypothetical protein BB558_007572 [Smittium angustum]